MAIFSFIVLTLGPITQVKQYLFPKWLKTSMSTDRKLFARTHNGIDVYVESGTSHVATHFQDNPELEELAREVVRQIDAKRSNIQADYDFNRTVGFSDSVETDSNDEIIYAKRANRKTHSRFVKNREPEPTSFVTVVLQRVQNGYLLLSAWLGPSVPPFPGDRREWPESQSFWKSHALILGPQAIDKTTVTSSCPWAH